MTCDELLKALNEYVDGALEPGICERFEKHLSGCNPCQVVVDNLRKTISLYKAGEPYPMPPEFRDSLRAVLKARWREKYPPAP